MQLLTASYTPTFGDDNHCIACLYCPLHGTV
jgi:hypothetical protein